MKGIAGLLGAALVLLAACAPPSGGKGESPYRTTAEGTLVWQEEYAFVPPGGRWELVRLEEDDYAFAFMRKESGPFPSQSTIAYAEEPFGYSLDFAKRSEEFFKRFLWAARVRFGEPKLTPVQLLGGQGLIAEVEGREPVKKQKVWCRVVFARRGERIVAFYFTQWRPEGVQYDPSAAEDFERFVASFRFLRPSFYEDLMRNP